MLLTKFRSLVKLSLWIFLVGFIIGCNDDEPERRIKISGHLKDSKTGSPIAEAVVKNCPGALFTLMPPGWTLYSTLVGDTTDECGYFEFTIPESEAHWVDMYPDAKAEGIILLFQSCTHNDALSIVEFDQSEGGDYMATRPVYDSLQWSFDPSGRALTIDFKMNNQYLLYYDKTLFGGRVSTLYLRQRDEGGIYQSIDTLNIVNQTWVSFTVENLDVSKEYGFSVISNLGFRARCIDQVITTEINVPVGIRPTSPVIQIPAENICN